MQRQAGLGIVVDAAKRLAVLRARRGDALHRRLESRVIELRRDAHGDREVEMADPDAVDSLERGDRFDLVNCFRRLDLWEKDHVPVGGAERRRRRALMVAVVGDADATPRAPFGA